MKKPHVTVMVVIAVIFVLGTFMGKRYTQETNVKEVAPVCTSAASCASRHLTFDH
jgi:hypothetical protein